MLMDTSQPHATHNGYPNPNPNPNLNPNQVESLGGTFLQVDYAEDGAGAGGYAKEMSDGFSRGDTNPRRRCEP